MTMTRIARRKKVVARAPGPAEYRLMAAVLEDAIDICRRARRRPVPRRLLRETEAWFESRDRTWPYSFERVCEALALSPVQVRADLRRWRMESLAELFPQLGEGGEGPGPE
jgi:hypothetical protein